LHVAIMVTRDGKELDKDF